MARENSAGRFGAGVTAVDVDATVFPFLQLHACLNDVHVDTLTAGFDAIPESPLRRQDMLLRADICLRDSSSTCCTGPVMRAQIAPHQGGEVRYQQCAISNGGFHGDEDRVRSRRLCRYTRFHGGDEAAEISKQIDRFIDEVLPTCSEALAFYEVKDQPETVMRLQKMQDYDEFFRQLLNSDRFVNMASQLLGDDVVARNLQWFNKPARVGSVTPAHQDGFYFMLEPNEAVTLWLALDLVDEENGCVRLREWIESQRNAPPPALAGDHRLRRFRPGKRDPDSGRSRRSLRPPLHDHSPGRCQHQRAAPGGVGLGLRRRPGRVRLTDSCGLSEAPVPTVGEGGQVVSGGRARQPLFQTVGRR